MDWLTEEAVTRGQLYFSWACFWIQTVGFIVVAAVGRRHYRDRQAADQENEELRQQNARLEQQVKLYVDQEIDRLLEAHGWQRLEGEWGDG